MQKFLLTLFTALCFTAGAQTVQPAGVPQLQSASWFGTKYLSTINGLGIVPRPVAAWPLPASGYRWLTYDDDSASFVGWDGARWLKIGSGGGGGNIPFDGNRPITRNFSTVTGVNLGTSDVISTLNELLFPSQVPTATLTVTYNATTSSALQIERTNAATLSMTLNWSASRQAFTQPLASILVNGVTQSFSQPSAPGTVSGTQAVTYVPNNTITYSNTVTTTDSKSAVANATVTALTRQYSGFLSTNTPTDAQIRGLALQPFKTTRIQGATVIANSSPNYLIIAFDESFDPTNISQIWVGGLDQTGAFTRTVRSFTNASGYTSNYIIYALNATTAAGVTYEIR